MAPAASLGAGLLCRAPRQPPVAALNAHGSRALTTAGGRRQWCCRRSAAVAAPRGRGRRLRCDAIGFELGTETTSKSAEKQAEELTRLAVSLLLYSGVLKGKAAQAFISVLNHLQKGSPLLLVQAYGDLYCRLAEAGAASWSDFLLDQVIKGSDSPLARAAEAGKPTAHLHAAAAHDLDVLQQLAVLERTLATWVHGTAYGVSDRWLEAASTLSVREPSNGSNGSGKAALPEWLTEEGCKGEAGLAAAAAGALLAPLSEAQHAALRAELAGKWRWSEGIELLERYHAAHGYGLVSQHSVLSWAGKLQAQDVLKGARELPAAVEEGLVEASHPAAATLVVALKEFISQPLSAARSPPHVAVCGPATDRWMYTSWALQHLPEQVADSKPLSLAAAGLRTLILPGSQLGSLADLAWSLSQHPKARFVVLVNNLGGSGTPVADCAAILSGVDGFSWPSNALVLAGFPAGPPHDLMPVFKHTATIEERSCSLARDEV